MKHIGLIGGLSWESTALYYQWINQQVRERCGGLHSARLLLYSVDFHDIEQCQRDNEWQRAGAMLVDAAQRLERAGADMLLICSNTMHQVAPQIEDACALPLLHIADVTAAAIKRSSITRVGLLATRFTMEREFYVGRLRERHGLEVLLPPPPARELVHRIIYEELCMGRINAGSRNAVQRIVADLAEQGAQAVIFGCTEITMLLDAAQLVLPVFDTTRLHVAAAVDMAIGE